MTIYFVKVQNFVKIGYSSAPMNRICTLQTANPRKLEILFFMPGSAATERELHSVFFEYHRLNEWYIIEGALAEFIRVGIDTFSAYTGRFEFNDTYQDERDWEYWKSRALTAEQRVVQINSISDGKQNLPSDWRLMSNTERLTMLELTPDEIVRRHGVSRKTAVRWLERSGQMSISVRSNGNGNGQV